MNLKKNRNEFFIIFHFFYLEILIFNKKEERKLI